MIDCDTKMPLNHWRKAGHTAVVTGGAKGLGFEAARQYAAVGMNVVIADRDEDALREAAQELAYLTGAHNRILARACDVADRTQVQALSDAAFDKFGSVHCLMNNAGIGLKVGAPWTDLQLLEQTLSVNLMGVVFGCNAFIPRMLASEQPGVIINTASKQGITRPPGNYAYNLSKAGVVCYTESVAYELSRLEKSRLTAHLLVPGFVYTPMVSRHIPQKPSFAWTAEQTIDFMLPCLDRGDFYIICPDNESPRKVDEKRIQWAADDLIKNRPALSRWRPEFKSAFEEFMKEQFP